MALESALCKIDGMYTNNLITYPYTSTAKDAVFVVSNKEGIIVLIKGLRVDGLETCFGETILIGIVLQQAAPGFVASDTIQRVIGKKTIDDPSPDLG